MSNVASGPGGRAESAAVTSDPRGLESRAEMVRLVGTGQRVLDLGCTDDQLAGLVRDRGNVIVGIVADPAAAEAAGGACERVIVTDLDAFDPGELADQRFDVVIAAGVLDQLKDPVAVLSRLRAALADDGFLVASVPNVAHASVRLALLQGMFPDARSGPRNRAQVRFFTRSTLRQTVTDAGLAVVELHAIELSPEDSDVPYDATLLPPGLLQALHDDADARAFEFIAVAVPFDAGGPRTAGRGVRALVEDLEDVREQLDRTRREATASQRTAEASIERHRAECSVLRVRVSTIAEQLQASTAREQALRDRLAAAQQALDERDASLQTIRQTRAWRAVSGWWKLKRLLTSRR